jgi:hypothetical protein
LKRQRIDDLGRAVDPLRLEARGRIRVRLAAIEPVLITGSRCQSGDEPFVQSIGASVQRVIRRFTLAMDLDLDRRCRGGPDRKVDTPVPDRRSEIRSRPRRRAVGHHEVAAIVEQRLPLAAWCGNGALLGISFQGVFATVMPIPDAIVVHERHAN